MTDQTHDSSRILEITLARDTGDGWPVILEDRRPGSLSPVRTEGRLELDLDELAEKTLAADYGGVLGRAVFHGPVLGAFAGAVSESDELRVLLAVEAPELQTLHWHRLKAPVSGGWDFLMLDRRTPLSLYLPSRSSSLFPPIGRHDLRALVVVAEPRGLEEYGLEAFGAGATAEAMRRALGSVECDFLGPVEGAVGPSTLPGLCRQLTRQRYSLLHLVAHGRFHAKTGDTLLYLETPPESEDGVHAVAGVELLEQLKRLGRGLPHLAFLAACESAHPEAEGALGGLAQRLVRELGLPAVVAMTEKVSLPTASALAAGFYRHFGEHGHADRALVESTLELGDAADVTVPALFSRLAGQPLWSDSVDRRLTDSEIEAGLERLSSLVKERAPVLEPELAELASTLRRTRDAAVLSEDLREARGEALRGVGNLSEEAADLTFHALALGQSPPPYDARCPFEGEMREAIEDLDASSGQALRRLLEERAAAAGLRFEEGLVSLILEESAGEPGAAVLIPRLLVELWRRRRGRWLRVAEYEHLGGALGVLAASAEESWSELPESERPWAEHLLASLFEPGEEPGDRAKAAPARLGELRPGGAPEAPIDELSRRFEAAGVLVISGAPDEDRDRRVEPAHGGLVTAWPRLARLVETRRDALVAASTLRRAARAWHASGGDEDPADDELLVHRGSRLDALRDALRRRELWPSAGEARYLDRCLERREAEALAELEAARRLASEAEARARVEAREARRLRRRALVISALTVLAMVLAAFAWNSARGERRARLLGLASALAAHGEALAESKLDLASLLAAESLAHFEDLGIERSFEARRSLLRTVTRHPGLARYLDSEGAAGDGHGGRILDLEASPRGDLVASAGSEGRVLAWSTDRLEVAGRSPDIHGGGHESGVLELAWHPGGRRLASVDEDGEVLVWDLAEDPASEADAIRFELAARLEGEEARGLAFSPDGEDLAIATAAGAVDLWREGEERRELHRFSRHDLWAVAFSPDGRFLAAGGREPAVFLWRLDTGEPSARVSLPRDRVLQLTFRADSTRLAVAGSGLVPLWVDVEKGSLLAEPEDLHGSWVSSATYLADTHILATGGADSRIFVWADGVVTEEGEAPPTKRFELRGHGAGWISGLAFVPEVGLFSSSLGGELVLWDDLLGQPDLARPLPGSALTLGVALSAGDRLATSSDEGVISVWNENLEEVTALTPSHTDTADALAWHPSESALASVSRDGTLLVWDMPAATLRHRLEVPESRVDRGLVSVAWSGESLVTGGTDGRIRVWDVTPGGGRQKRLLPGHEESVLGLAPHPREAGALASVSSDRLLTWNGDPLERHLEIEAPQGYGFVSLAWTPDGETLVTGGLDNAIRLWNVSTGEPRGGPLLGAGGMVRSLAITPDGRDLVALSYGEGLLLFDLEKRLLVGALSGEKRLFGAGSNVTISSDGRRAITGTLLPSELLPPPPAVTWDLDTSNWSQRACKRANRHLTPEEWRRFLAEDAAYKPTC